MICCQQRLYAPELLISSLCFPQAVLGSAKLPFQAALLALPAALPVAEALSGPLQQLGQLLQPGVLLHQLSLLGLQQVVVLHKLCLQGGEGLFCLASIL